MRTFLINVKTGLVLGGYSRRGTGWAFQPYTSAHGGSRKAHATKAAASLRYTSPYCMDVDAETPQAASVIAKQRQADFNAKKPCCVCSYDDKQDGCAIGAAPSLARTLGKCAKFLSEADGNAVVEDAIADPRPLAEPLKFDSHRCKKHPDVVLAHAQACCPKCESEIDAAIMPTIKEPMVKPPPLSDVVIYEIATRRVDTIAGRDLGEVGFHNVNRRLDTVAMRLNDRYDCEAVPAGKYKVGDILDEADL